MGDLVARKFSLEVSGSEVFKDFWKAWESIKHLNSGGVGLTNNNSSCGEKSICWNLVHKGKPFALYKIAWLSFWPIKVLR